MGLFSIARSEPGVPVRVRNGQKRPHNVPSRHQKLAGKLAARAARASEPPAWRPTSGRSASLGSLAASVGDGAADRQNAKAAGSRTGLSCRRASSPEGVLESLLVVPKGDDTFAVVAGGRRLAALQRLAQAGELPVGYVAPCRVCNGGADPAEMSLHENEKRVPMHSADQYEAYARLRAKDMTAAEIRTAIVQACLVCEPELAFDLPAYQTVSAIFGGKPDGSLAIEITATPDASEGVDPDDREAVARRSPGARMLSAETADLKLDWLRAPTPRERFLQFRVLKPKERRRQFAAAGARSLTPSSLSTRTRVRTRKPWSRRSTSPSTSCTVFATARIRTIRASRRPQDVVVAGASSDRHSRRVLAAVKVAALRPRFAGLSALTAAPRTLVRTGSYRTTPNLDPLHVVVDGPSRIAQSEVSVDRRQRDRRRGPLGGIAIGRARG